MGEITIRALRAGMVVSPDFSGRLPELRRPNGVNIFLMRAPAFLGALVGIMPERRYPNVNTNTRTRLLAFASAATVALAACGGAAAPAATAAPA